MTVPIEPRDPTAVVREALENKNLAAARNELNTLSESGVENVLNNLKSEYPKDVEALEEYISLKKNSKLKRSQSFGGRKSRKGKKNGKGKKTAKATRRR